MFSSSFSYMHFDIFFNLHIGFVQVSLHLMLGITFLKLYLLLHFLAPSLYLSWTSATLDFIYYWFFLLHFTSYPSFLGIFSRSVYGYLTFTYLSRNTSFFLLLDISISITSSPYYCHSQLCSSFFDLYRSWYHPINLTFTFYLLIVLPP